MAKRMKQVCTAAQRMSSRASPAANASLPSRPRMRAKKRSATVTCHVDTPSSLKMNIKGGASGRTAACNELINIPTSPDLLAMRARLRAPPSDVLTDPKNPTPEI
jgi:hypothetical protein